MAQARRNQKRTNNKPKGKEKKMIKITEEEGESIRMEAYSMMSLREESQIQLFNCET